MIKLCVALIVSAAMLAGCAERRVETGVDSLGDARSATYRNELLKRLSEPRAIGMFRPGAPAEVTDRFVNFLGDPDARFCQSSSDEKAIHKAMEVVSRLEPTSETDRAREKAEAAALSVHCGVRLFTRRQDGKLGYVAVIGSLKPGQPPQTVKTGNSRADLELKLVAWNDVHQAAVRVALELGAEQTRTWPRFDQVPGDVRTVSGLGHRLSLLVDLAGRTPTPRGASPAFDEWRRYWAPGGPRELTNLLVGANSATWCALPLEDKRIVIGLQIARFSADAYRRIDEDLRKRCGMRLFVRVDADRTRYVAVYGFGEVDQVKVLPAVRRGEIDLIVVIAPKSMASAKAGVLARRALAGP